MRTNLFVKLSLLFVLITLAACGGAVETAPQESDVAVATSLPTSAALTEDDQSAEPVAEPEATEATEATTETEANAANEPVAGIADPNPAALVADSGFRPNPNGFSFENYSGDTKITDLTAAEVYRMFGDVACASVANGVCTLTPPGQQWMEQINSDMAGGHCEGMATLSLLMFTDTVKESSFGGQNAADLKLDNPALQREIAYWWTTQATSPTVDRVIKGTPNEILEILRNKTDKETYTIGIYKSDGTGGHAITPFGVEEAGNGVYAILVYDNNYPGQTRRVLVDTKNNIWSYEAAINPQTESELYQGDAETQTLDLTPSSARLDKQVCPFCDGAEATGSSGSKLAAPSDITRYNEIFLDGDGHLLIEDDTNKRMGIVEGRWLNEIPNAQAVWLKTASPLEDQPEPIYWLPADLNVTATLDGSTFTGEGLTDLVLIGPGYSFGVEGISLEPDQVDTVRFEPKDSALVYDTDKSESPTIIVAVEEELADFAFEIQGADMQGGGQLVVLLNQAAGDLVINADKLLNSGTFNLAMTRYSDESEQTFYTDELALQAGAIIYISYADWTEQSAGLVIEVDTDGDGVMDETYTADNQS